MSVTITLTDEELTEITTALERLSNAITQFGIGKYFNIAGERLNRACEKLEEELTKTKDE